MGHKSTECGFYATTAAATVVVVIVVVVVVDLDFIVKEKKVITFRKRLWK